MSCGQSKLLKRSILGSSTDAELMKVLHVVPSYLPATRYGGPIYSVHGLCKSLVERGVEVDVYTTNVDGPGVSDVDLGSAVSLDGVQVSYFPTGLGRRLYRSPRMGEALARNMPRFDVVHLHSVFLWPTTRAAFEARRFGIPYIISPRGMLVPGLIQRKSRLLKSAWIYTFERRNISGAAGVHVTADLEAQELCQFNFEPKRIDIIPNGIDLLPDSELAALKANAIRQTVPVVFSLGRMNWKKGLDRLILAMTKTEKARLVLAGNDEENYASRLTKLVAENNLMSRTQILGPLHGRAKWEAFAQSDIFALPSYSENFGIAVLEAMACGLPVVITPEVGLAKTVKEVGAGIVVSGDPSEFGAALAHLIAHPELRREMGERGRRAAKERFSWNSVAEQMEDLYSQVVAVRSNGVNIAPDALAQRAIRM